MAVMTPVALDDTLRAVGTALVDSKLKGAKMTTGQMLVAFEQTLRHVLKASGASAGQSGGLAARAADMVHSQLVPSWSTLRGTSAPAALVQLLFHVEQRLLLAHTGAMSALCCM
jgi:hypothetical protein